MSRIIEFVKTIWALIMAIFSKKKKEENIYPPKEEEREKMTWSKEELLSPVLHKRYTTIYCIADLTFGDIPILDRHGNALATISKRSKKRLVMEGTGRLENGKVVNVDVTMNRAWRFKMMGEDSPHGIGIRGKALVPWVSVANELSQLKHYNLFGRTVVIPEMRGYEKPGGTLHDGLFEIHDTGGGLRECPYNRGLWRTGDRRSEYGQFDIFMGGPESVYKELLGTWDSYREVFIMPSDVDSVVGAQETINLLLDEGLKVDGITGPKTEVGIKRIQGVAGLEQSGNWDDKIKEFATLSLQNW